MRRHILGIWFATPIPAIVEVIENVINYNIVEPNFNIIKKSTSGIGSYYEQIFLTNDGFVAWKTLSINYNNATARYKAMLLRIYS